MSRNVTALINSPGTAPTSGHSCSLCHTTGHREVASERHDERPQFNVSDQIARECLHAVHGAEEASGSCTRAVAVARVVHREKQRTPNVVGRKGGTVDIPEETP